MSLRHRTSHDVGPCASPHPDFHILALSQRTRCGGSRDSLWLRILDIPTVLLARTYAADLSAVVHICDTQPGESTFALTVCDGKAQVVPTDDSPDVHTDLSVLGSIYLGAHRPSDFVMANRLRCNDAHLIKQLDFAFASDVPARLGYDF